MKVALIQQSNGKDTSANLDKLQENIRKCAAEGAELVVLQELHNSLYFCQTENPDYFGLAETIPGPSTDYFGKLAGELGVVLFYRYSKSDLQACITTRQRCSKRMAQ